MLASRGRRDEARGTLTKIYGWFTEGFDTGDLREAKQLLEELQQWGNFPKQSTVRKTSLQKILGLARSRCLMSSSYPRAKVSQNIELLQQIFATQNLQ